MAPRKRGELFGKFLGGTGVPMSQDTQRDVYGLPPKPDPPKKKGGRTNSLRDPTKPVRRRIVDEILALGSEGALHELRHLAAAAGVTPPSPADDIATYARNVLIGGHFTADELLAIRDGLLTRSRASSSRPGATEEA